MQEMYGPIDTNHAPSRRLKLLKFVTDFNIGGTEKHVLHLSRSLDREKFDLHIACLRRRGDLLGVIEESRLPLSEFRITSLRNHTTLREQFRFVRHIRENRFEIVHTYGFYANVFAIPPARLANSPIVLASIRDTGAHLTSAQMRVQRVICRLADHILVNALAVKRWLVETGYRTEKITVIHNGIVPPDPAPPGAGDALSREAGLPVGSPVIAVVSRLNHLKGVDYFLEAAAIVLRDFPDARFLVIGDGLHKPALERHAAMLGIGDKVVFTGFRLDIPRLLSGVTISVSPSLSEGLSNSLLESMAAGVPVVATRVGGNSEVIEDRVSGLLVPVRDPIGMASAICSLLKERGWAMRLGRAGRDRILNRFSMAAAARATEQLYRTLLESRRNPRKPSPMKEAS